MSTFHNLLLIACQLIPSRLTVDNAALLTSDVYTAAVEESASATTAYRALIWVSKESGGLSIMGDNGKACGAGQLHSEWWDGNECSAILTDRVLAIRLWIRMFHYLTVYCKSEEKALAAIACGKCDGALLYPKVKGIVVNRERLVIHE